MKQIFFMALSFFSLFSCSAGIKDLNVEQFASAVADGVTTGKLDALIFFS